MTHDRTKYLGSHDNPAIAGVHPFKSPLQVYLEKTGQAAPVPVNENMEWGLRNQGAVLKKYTEVNSIPDLSPECHYDHPECPFIGSTPDGFSMSACEVVEVKTNRYKQRINN